MTTEEIMTELESLGLESIKKTLLRHGISEPLFGVKIEELKKMLKKVKENHTLSLELYDTGNYDAMYLAGLVAEPRKMTQEELRHWAAKASAPVLSECTVAWVAAEGQHGMEMALEWIQSPEEKIACSGWATLSGVVAINDDKNLDIPLLLQLLESIPGKIHSQPNRVKLAMNSFVISAGTHSTKLYEAAVQTALKIGKVTADMGDTACKIPDAMEYIKKAEGKNAIGKKKKGARC